MSISANFPPFLSSRYCEHDLEYLTLREETNVELILMGRDDQNCDFFNCVLKSDVRQFMELDRQIQLDGAELESDIPYEPLVDEICMVKVNGKWLRSKFLGIGSSEDQIHWTVYCIDYGVNCLVSSQNIRVRTKLGNKM